METRAAGRQSTVHSRSQIIVNAPILEVWHLLADVRRWPEWNSAVQKVAPAGDLSVGQPFRWKSRGLTVTSTPIEVQAPHRLAWRGFAFGTKAWHSWTLTPTEGGVLVETEETFEGWLPGLIPRSMQRTLDEALPAWLAALKARAETARSTAGQALVASRSCVQL